MKRLNHKRLIPGIHLSGLMDSIISTLLPSWAIIKCNRAPLNVCQEEWDQAGFSTIKVAEAKLHSQYWKQRSSFIRTVSPRCIRRFLPDGVKNDSFYAHSQTQDQQLAYQPLYILDLIGKLYKKLLMGRLWKHLITRRYHQEPVWLQGREVNGEQRSVCGS